jgi:hypothetical protein
VKLKETAKRKGDIKGEGSGFATAQEEGCSRFLHAFFARQASPFGCLDTPVRFPLRPVAIAFKPSVTGLDVKPDKPTAKDKGREES